MILVNELEVVAMITYCRSFEPAVLILD